MTAEERVLFYYENLDDEQFAHHILYELDGIEPEFVEPLREMVKKRELDNKLLDVIDVYGEECNDSELTELCNNVSRLRCPICDNDRIRLNAIYAHGIKSKLYTPQISHLKLFVGCGPCLVKVVKKAFRDQILFAILITGWFLPRLIFNNRKCKRQIRIAKQKQHTPAFKEFVKRRRGLFVFSEDSSDEFRNVMFRL